jgi:hypothetical protein
MPTGTGILYNRSGRDNRIAWIASGERGKDLMDDIITIIADMQRFPYENPPALAADHAGFRRASPVHHTIHFGAVKGNHG